MVQPGFTLAGGSMNVFIRASGALFGLLMTGCDLLPTDPGEEPAGPPIVTNRMAIGVTHSCALTPQGDAYCWGANESGQLGDGTFTDRPSPVRVATDERFVAIVAGGDRTTSPVGYTCALTEAGAAFCWGNNERLQIGSEAAGPTPTPVRVELDRELVQISAGHHGTCGVSAEGGLYCWGSVDLGGGEGPRRLPSDIAFASVSVGEDHVCALDRDGDAFCMGYNHVGQLGDGTRANRWDELVPVAGGSKFKVISAGATGRTCGVTTDDQLYCWGRVPFGDLPTGTPIPLPFPGIPSVTTVDAGYLHACVVTLDGKTLCWGNNGWGQLGDGTWAIRDDPVAVEGSATWEDIALGGYHACGLTSAGAVWCWGSNERGQIGRGDAPTRGPVAVDAPHDWIRLAAGQNHQFGGESATSCGVAAFSELYCWGSGGLGTLGIEAVRNAPAPTRVGTFVNVDLGAGFACALDESGGPWCWGVSSAVDYGPTPSRMAGGEPFDSLAVGNSHACATTADGAVYCWGRGDSGQVGRTYDGCTTPRLVGCNLEPVRLETDRSFVAVTAGLQHTCGIDVDRRAYCWGTGGLGRSGANQSFTPQAVAGELEFGMLSAGSEHTCGVTTGGDLYCWGDNRSGQLGTGDTETREEPVQIASGTGFSIVSAGHDHTCAVTDGGETLCWGSNATRQLGPGDPASTSTPISAGAPAGMTGLTAGIGYTCGWRRDGEAFCWGKLGFGRLGNGEWAGSTVPVRVAL